jgi:hypothetical protein
VDDDRALEHDDDSWSVERAYVNDPDYVGDAQSFTSAALSSVLSAHPDRTMIVDKARRVVTELFENATHTKAPLIRLNLCVEHEVLRIDVEDHRRGMPTCTPVRFESPASETVSVTGELASRWDSEPTAEGMHVWAEIALA